MTSIKLRNFIRRVEKKERQVPSHRESHGHVERKKDYKVRAEQNHAKERMFREMRFQASQKNPDEFYHAMENMRTHGGVLVHIPPTSQLEDANDAIPDVVLNAAAKRLQKEYEDTAMRLPEGAKSKHIVFCGDKAVNIAKSKARVSVPDGKQGRKASSYAGERAAGASDADSTDDADSEDAAEELHKNLVSITEKMGKVDQEVARREARARARKSGPAYKSKEEIGLDKYGNKLYKFHQRRCR